MTMATFHLQIVTPDRLVYDGEARQIILRTVGGDAAILAGHIDYSAPLGIGEAKLTDAEGNDITDWFERLVFAFSSEDSVLMQVKRNESTLAGGEEDNILTGDYTFLPR